MTIHKAKWLLVGLACLAFWPAHAPAQYGQWNKLNAAGIEAHQRGDYAEAEKQWSAALKEAEGFGPQSPRLATSLSNLAALYNAQGRYGEAEPLLKRVLAIDEKALRPDHPNLAIDITILAQLYQAQGRYADAEPLYERSSAIWEKALGPDHPEVAKATDRGSDMAL